MNAIIANAISAANAAASVATATAADAVIIHINKNLYRSPDLDNTKDYADALSYAKNMLRIIKPIAIALETVSTLRSDDPNYNILVHTATNAVAIPDADEWMHMAIVIGAEMRKNGAELAARRASYLASLKYKHAFNFLRVAKLPLDVRLVICSYVGFDTVFAASAITCVGNIEMRDFLDKITKPQLSRIIMLTQTLVKEVDDFVIQSTMRAFVNRLTVTGIVNHDKYLQMYLIMPMLDFPTKNNTKSVITKKLAAVFDIIIDKLYAMDLVSRKKMLMNMRKLGAVLKAVRASREKKMKRKMISDSTHLFKSKDTPAFVEPPVFDELEAWLELSEST